MDNTDPVWPIQAAIYQALTGDAELMAEVTGVYDHVPKNTEFPYISIGETTVTPGGAHDRFGSRSTITIHGWSTYHGKREISALANHLVRILDHQPLEIEGLHTVYVHHAQTVTQTEQDNDIRHVACRFSIETEHAA
ncbi:DUF3168 domain-containing protein [Nesterenkonia sp. HG001]|uniref:DUF3168 domain-containing protein n=1 Tax=Nesterenkonia sp. HG001 TaxID=2983207 RepID=UPI002AC74998|nr:DUF3168 domain-containing protein [Nesterenkonia sp. HG001]MDZ5077868.1 DUF3168 domain-containing protein [Nesterenkonia sp. HG001]